MQSSERWWRPGHPKLTDPVELDFLPTEIEGIKVADIVQLDITLPDGVKRDATMTPADFNKLASGGQNMESVLANGRGTRGRRAQAV